ncbi:MAG TPA: hypothetical protein PLN48_10890, partial [Lachnospiraceae bacterium]|nr:hypothetical protein [Lachnospiraceae bacterium]
SDYVRDPSCRRHAYLSRESASGSFCRFTTNRQCCSESAKHGFENLFSGISAATNPAGNICIIAVLCRDQA